MPAAAPSAKRLADSRAAILAAATEEFVARGLDGVRMEHIAKRAGYNKALVYKHFGDRQALFEAVLEAAFSSRRAVLDRQPRELGLAMAAWSEAAFAAPAYGKLIMREALEHAGDEPVLAKERRQYYAEQIDGVAQAQALGRLPSGLDPKHLFLALMSVVCLPAFLPGIAELATGENPGGEAFQAEWRAFLQGFAARLGAPAEDGGDVDV